MATESAHGDIRFHWFPSTSIPYPPSTNFPKDAKIRIGAAIKANTTCRPDERTRWRWSERFLGNLGVQPSRWYRNQRQGGFSAGQYFNLNYIQVYSKVPGRTLKEAQMSHPEWPTYPFLQAFWGVQVSFCTGVARRVRLRELLADTIPAYMHSLLWRPPEWKKLQKEGFIDALQADDVDLQEWFEERPGKLQTEARDIIRRVLSSLQCTGVNDNSDMVVGWIIPEKQFRRFSMPCKDQNAWAKILADSEDCATFAYVTATCLETDCVKCQKATIWENKLWALGTAVSCYNGPNTDQEMDEDGTTTPELMDGDFFNR